MKMLAVITLTLLGFWLLTVKWGILSIACAGGAYWLIKQDRNGAMQNSFFAICFGLIIVGAVLGFLGF